MLDFFIDMRGDTAAIAAGWNTSVWVFFLVFTLFVVLATIIVTRLFTRGKKQLRKELADAEAQMAKAKKTIDAFNGGRDTKSLSEALARLETNAASIVAEIDRARTIRSFALGWDTLQPHEQVGANGVRVAIAMVAGADHWKEEAQRERDEFQRQLTAANRKIVEFENDNGEAVSIRKLNKLIKENGELRNANAELKAELKAQEKIENLQTTHSGQFADIAKTSVTGRLGNGGGNKKGGNTQQANP